MFVGAATAKLEHVADVVSAKAATLVDNLVIVDAIQQNIGHSMIDAPILDVCRTLLHDFGKALLEHCNRESNMVAHALAHNGRVDPPNLWLGAPPDSISALLADDVSVV